MKTKKLCYMALLTTIALTIFMVEAQLPALAPIPGLKLGLANIVTIYAMFALGPGETLLILLSRIFLGSVFSGQMMSLIYSLSGGLCCFGITTLMRRLVTEEQIWAASVVGAMFHNLGQILAAALVMRTWVVFYYLPLLLISSVVTGAFTGLCAQFLRKRLRGMAKVYQR